MIEQRISIKPMSANVAYTGRRFKTKKYRAYRKELMLSLKNKQVPDGDLEIEILWGLDVRGDVDNPIKPFLDILQEKYQFNDVRVKKITVEKVRGEFIDFKIKVYGK